MKIRTLMNPSLLAAGLLLGMTTAVQADSGHISAILHDNGNTYDLGYSYGDYGYCCNRHHHPRRDHGHHHGHYKKHYWHPGRGHHKQRVHHYRHHDGHRGVPGNGRDGGYRHDRRRHGS